MSDKHIQSCSVCQHGPEEIDWSLSNVAISQIVNCSEASVRRHKKWVEANGFAIDQPAEVTDDPNQPAWVRETGVPRRAWQLPDGTWRQSFQHAGDGASAVEMLDYSTLAESLADFEYTPGLDLTGKPEFFVWADPQFGKAGERGGGTRETIARTFKARDSFIDRVKVSKPRTIYLVDLGDPIENCFSTGSQIGTNDLSVPDQVLTYERVTVELIKAFLPYAEEVIHVTVTSNHGEARNGLKNNPYGSENDWGLHMQQVVKDRFSERPDLPVSFVRPEPMEDTSVVVTEDGTIVAFAHGHHAGSPSNVKKWVEGQVVGERPGHEAHMWVLGHFHHDYRYSFGNGKTIMGAPSCDPGSAWVTRKKGETAVPGVLAFTATNGSWANYSIL